MNSTASAEPIYWADYASTSKNYTESPRDNDDKGQVPVRTASIK